MKSNRAIISAVGFVLGLWLLIWPTTATADATSLRIPTSTCRICIVGDIPLPGGRTQLSAGSWLTPQLGISTELRLSLEEDIAAISAWMLSVGTKWHLAGKPTGWGLKAFLSGGILIPTLSPTFGLHLTPAIHGGYYGSIFRITLGLVAPIEMRFHDPFLLRLPLFLELWLGWQINRFFVGIRAHTGGMLVPGQAWALQANLALAVSAQF